MKSRDRLTAVRRRLAIDLAIQGDTKMKIVPPSGASPRRLTAVFLLFAFVVLMIQPNLIVRAQESARAGTQTNDPTHPKKAKKKKAKRGDASDEGSQETKQIVLPPVFNASPAQQPTAAATIDQKAKPLGKPTVKPEQLPVGRTY